MRGAYPPLPSAALAHFSTAIRRFKHGLTGSKRNHNIITSVVRIRPRRMHIPAFRPLRAGMPSLSARSPSTFPTSSAFSFSQLFLSWRRCNVERSFFRDDIDSLYSYCCRRYFATACTFVFCVSVSVSFSGWSPPHNLARSGNTIIPKIPWPFLHVPFSARRPWKKPDIGFSVPHMPRLKQFPAPVLVHRF